MRCEDVRAGWLEARYARSELPPELHEHVRGCVSCADFCAAQEALEVSLQSMENVSAGPGFDTRFFARLQEQKQQKQAARAVSWTRRLWWALLPLTAASVAGVLVYQRSQAERETTDAAVAADMELLQDLPVVEQLDQLEDYEVLANVDVSDFERLEQEGAP